MKQDEILTDELVIAADGWRTAGYAEAQPVEIEGKTGVYLPEGEWVIIPFPETRHGRESYNQMVLEVYCDVSSTGMGHLSVSVEMGVIPVGFEEKDRLVTDRYFHESGWWTLQIPLISFLPYGMSNDFTNAERIRMLTGHGRVAVGEMRLQVVKQPEGPRMTDEELMAELDLDRPSLAPAKQAWERGDLGAALAAVAEHFRTRTEPRQYYLDLIPKATQETIAQADRMCDGYVQGYRFDEIDWMANPNGYQEWPTHLNYMSWPIPLMSAYLSTKDEKYPRRLDEVLFAWARGNPRPLCDSGTRNWGPHRPAARIMRCWPWAWYSTLDSPSFQDRTRVAMLKTWWEMVEHTLEWSYVEGTNGRLSDSRAVFIASILLPEFKRAKFWREEGRRMLDTELKKQVHTDGVHFELAGYHSGCLNSFFEVYRMAKLNGIELDDEYLATINRMLDYSAHSQRSCGGAFPHNDSGGCVSLGKRAGRRSPHPIAQELGRDDLRFIFEGDGEPPVETSRAFPYTGMYFMRGGWDPEDLCLCFDGATFGAGHQHEDKLSIDVSGYGKEFIVDPGIHSYMLDRFRDYMSSSYAHSTIHIDGKPQNRMGRQTREQWIREVYEENQWYTGEVFDYAKSQYDAGYGEPEPDEGPQPVHHRVVIFVRGDYFLVFDYVEGEGNHRVESMLHFAPMPVFIDEGQATFRTFNQSPANLEAICLPGPPRPEMSVICGQNDPLQGWVALGWGHPSPAPVAIMTWEQELPLLAGMLLIPYKEGRSAQLALENLLCEGTAWAGQVKWPDGRRDLILLRFDGEDEVKLDGLRTDARVAVVRMNAEGEVVARDHYRGTHLDI